MTSKWSFASWRDQLPQPMSNSKRVVLAAAYVATQLTPEARLQVVRAMDGICGTFLKEGLGTGLMVSTAMRFIVSLAAEQRWSKAQLFQILDAIHDDARPGADAVFAEAREKLG